jgi:hypothetical protein
MGRNLQHNLRKTAASDLKVAEGVRKAARVDAASTPATRASSSLNWQRERAMIVHRACMAISRRRERGVSLHRAVVRPAWNCRNRFYRCEPTRRVRLSRKTFIDIYYHWRANGQNLQAVQLHYRSNRPKIPSRLVLEFVQLCVSPGVPSIRAGYRQLTKTCDEHGLPHKGFYFEGGIWKNSRLLKGNQNETPFSWSEAELGLRALGLKFVHSRLPRSKPIERVLGALQDMMDGEPGFVGGNEMKEKFERVQRHKLDVDARKVHPSEYFYDLDQWTAKLDELCERYNADRQDGKMTDGLSPDEAFDKFNRTNDPPIKLPAGCRYLLSHHKRPLKVTSNGITLRFGKQVFNYRDEQTGKLRGQTVLAWFNPETPEILSVTDMNRENPICVVRTQEVPAMEAPADLLAQEMGKINAHLSYARTRYRILKARVTVPFRRTFADTNTVLLGVEMAEQQNKAIASRDEQQKLQTKARKVLDGIGMTTAGRPVRPDQVESAQRLAELLNEETL